MINTTGCQIKSGMTNWNNRYSDAETPKLGVSTDVILPKGFEFRKKLKVAMDPAFF